MNVRTASLSILWSLALAPPAPGQFMQVVEAKTISSQTLSGHVVHANDEGYRLAGVLVELCDDKWKNPFASTVTDSAGEFRFEGKPKGIYHLRLSLAGMNPLLVTVRIKSRAPKTLSLRMWLAT